MTRHSEDCMVCRMNTLQFTDEQREFVAEIMSVTSGTTWAAAKKRPPRDPDATMSLILDRAANIWGAIFGTVIPESDEVAEHRHQHGDQ